MTDQAPGRIHAATLEDLPWQSMTESQNDALYALASSVPAFRAERAYNASGAAAAAGLALMALGFFLAAVVGIYSGSALALDLLPGLAAFAEENPITTGFGIGLAVLAVLYPIASIVCGRRVDRAEFEELTGDR